MTVLQRLAKKNLVTQIRDDRAHKYVPTHPREDLVASLMVDALSEADAPDPGMRHWCRSSAASAPRRPPRCATHSMRSKPHEITIAQARFVHTDDSVT